MGGKSGPGDVIVNAHRHPIYEGKAKAKVCERRKKKERPYLVLNFLYRQCSHFLDKAVADSVQFHRLTPIVESACNEHLARIVRPASNRLSIVRGGEISKWKSREWDMLEARLTSEM